MQQEQVRALKRLKTNQHEQGQRDVEVQEVAWANDNHAFFCRFSDTVSCRLEKYHDAANTMLEFQEVQERHDKQARQEW